MNPEYVVGNIRIHFESLGAAGIVYVTLPQAILLWTEPDMEAAQ